MFFFEYLYNDCSRRCSTQLEGHFGACSIKFFQKIYLFISLPIGKSYVIQLNKMINAMEIYSLCHLKRTFFSVDMKFSFPGLYIRKTNYEYNNLVASCTASFKYHSISAVFWKITSSYDIFGSGVIFPDVKLVST